ncbi:MAG: transglutaminase domain-containing protein [Eubacteriales bacterium]|nr:transglutaminase domain-containing protein [Eubacteriales bacterium]
MKKLINILKISLISLAVVICAVIARQQIMGVLKDTKSYEKNNNHVEDVTCILDVLPTVAQADNSQEQTPADGSTIEAGYKPVTGKGEITNETVLAESEISYEYDFPEDIYAYRAMLSDNEKLVYDQIYHGVEVRNEQVTLCRQLDKNSINNVMAAVFNDNPEFFWLDTAYTYGYTTKGVVVYVTLSYNSTLETIQTSRIEFLNAASKIINTASQYSGDYEKEQSVYMQLQNLVRYDENSQLNQSAYSALVNGTSVCAGYARAFQYIMQKLNIPCYFCSGTVNGGNHAWNIVRIDGKYYNADLSWDDTLGEATGQISYSYFNLSDNTFGLDHLRSGLSKKLPNCVISDRQSDKHYD